MAENKTLKRIARDDEDETAVTHSIGVQGSRWTDYDGRTDKLKPPAFPVWPTLRLRASRRGRSPSPVGKRLPAALG
jgi:hypothetical protein